MSSMNIAAFYQGARRTYTTYEQDERNFDNQMSAAAL